MKRTIASTLVLSSLAALAIPQSPVVTYGLVRDEYGNPIKRSSALSAKLVKADAPDGFVYASTTVGETAYPDMNYRLQLEIDSEGPTRSYAVLEGTEMRIRFFIGDEEQPATPTPVFTTPANGTAQRKDYALGTDADGDGLPDAWEAWVLSAGGNASDAAAIAAFAPGADADGDGMSNYREFLAGTDPFISTDLLEITRFVKTGSGDRTEIRFTTVPGRSYRVVSTATLEDPVWTPVATSRNAEGEAAYETYSGTGRQITVYIDTPGTDSAFFRVAAQ